jgi:hypothetical protein
MPKDKIIAKQRYLRISISSVHGFLYDNIIFEALSWLKGILVLRILWLELIAQLWLLVMSINMAISKCHSCALKIIFLWLQIRYSHMIVVHFKNTGLFSTLLCLYIDLKGNGFHLKVYQKCKQNSSFCSKTSMDWRKWGLL